MSCKNNLCIERVKVKSNLMWMPIKVRSRTRIVFEMSLRVISLFENSGLDLEYEWVKTIIKCVEIKKSLLRRLF